MPTYDFTSLSPLDFESLVRDLLQAELGVRFESFKSGRDQGIDLRHCSANAGAIIVQCKHFAGSTFADLIRHVRGEVPKVQRLRPGRYILVTSQGLTPDNKDKLALALDPFVLSPSDILGRDDLNNLLGLFPKVEKEHFKLWLPTIGALERFLETRQHNLAREALDRIHRNMKVYVHNPSFGHALRTLDEHHFCIIAGIPGIGKTTLAEMLLLHHAARDYEVVVIEQHISEARSVDYVNQRRIFYYDDFLGQASTGEKLHKNEDQSLLTFMEALRNSRTSRLVLTTREYILAQAQLTYERLDRENFAPTTCVINLASYTRLVRAQILFNHLFFSELPPEYKRSLVGERTYVAITDHDNYNPRVVSFMTEPRRVTHRPPQEYSSLFLANLDDPREVWRHAYEEQLSHAARNLLLVLVTLPTNASLDDFERAFNSCHSLYATRFNVAFRPDEFQRALRELDGNFTRTQRIDGGTALSFHNPSVRDFMQLQIQYVSLVTLILESAIFFDQVEWLWSFQDASGHFPCRAHLMARGAFLAEAVLRTLPERCRHAESYHSSFGARGWRLTRSNSEITVKMALELIVESQLPHLLGVVDHVLAHLGERIQHRLAKSSDLQAILPVLRSLGTSEPVSVLGAMKAHLLRSPELLEDFEAYLEFDECFPYLLDDEERESAREFFRDYLRGEEDYPDANAAREDALRIERLGDAFSIDVSSKISSLSDIAEKFERGFDDTDDERSGSGLQSEHYADAELDSLFEGFTHDKG